MIKVEQPRSILASGQRAQFSRHGTVHEICSPVAAIQFESAMGAGRVCQSNPAATTTADPTVFMPSAAPMAPIATIPRIPPITPAVTVPIDETGRPSLIQPTEYCTTTTQPSNPLPLPPPAQASPAKPRVIYSQPLPESPTSVPLSVRQRLNEMCAGKCRNLAVELASPMHLRVAFMVRDQVEADMLTNLLGGISELAPYKVDFEVQIGQ